jgi:hypothetical protein
MRPTRPENGIWPTRLTVSRILRRIVIAPPALSL